MGSFVFRECPAPEYSSVRDKLRASERYSRAMKSDTHPAYFPQAEAKCAAAPEQSSVLGSAIVLN